MRSREVLIGVIALLALSTGCDQSLRANGQSARSSGTDVWLEVSPATVEPGLSVSIRAACGDSTSTATVASKALRTLTLEPSDHLLRGSTTVLRTTKAGKYEVVLTCQTGATARTQLSVVTGGTAPSTVGPATGGGFLAGDTDKDDSGGER